MNFIATITRNIILTDPVHFQALKYGTLNLRAYSARIHQPVETAVKKKVALSSIVIALSRLKKSISSSDVSLTPIALENVHHKLGLSVITYDKVAQTLKELGTIAKLRSRDKEYFVISEGVHEVTIVGEHGGVDEVERMVRKDCKLRLDDVTAVTVIFDQNHLEVQHIVYALVIQLELKNINLIQVVSNLTEITFILEQKYLDDTLEIFKKYLGK